MDCGPYNRYDASYFQACKEAKVVCKGTPEEQELLRSLYKKAGEIVGREWNEFSSRQTTDEGIEESAQLMGRYRILLAEIMHRNAKFDTKD